VDVVVVRQRRWIRVQRRRGGTLAHVDCALWGSRLPDWGFEQEFNKNQRELDKNTNKTQIGRLVTHWIGNTVRLIQAPTAGRRRTTATS
jgi:hypothetical protein